MQDGKFQYVVEDNSFDINQFCAEPNFGYDLTPCIYCGLPSNSIDHIPPRSMRGQLTGVELVAMHEREVCSCRECNSALGSRPLLTITERREYVKDYLRKKYRSYLKMKQFTELELAEFGEGLQGMLRRNMAMRDLICQRLRWPS